MNDNKLHIIPVLEKGQTYDASTGTLILDKEGSIFVTIKQYQEDEKKIKELEKKKKSSLEFARQKWEERAKEGWSERKLKENYDANMKDWEKLNEESQVLIEKYENVNWCWQLVGNKLNYNSLSHNESFNKGISQIKSTGKQKVAFPALLVGGGMAWLEAFHEEDGAMGDIPYGIYVKAKGTPKILRTEWTDFNYQPIVESVGFMSKVILHIYTSGMYGQEVEIELKDRDLFTANDQLSFSGKASFIKEVNITKVKKNDIGKIEVAGLIKREQTTTDNIVEKEQYTQKIEIEVLVDAIWEIEGGKSLKIFPTIKSKETGTYFEDFDLTYLSVDGKSLILTATKEVSNHVSVIGAVETNESAFHHCQYTEITLEYEKGEKTEEVEIFKENPGVSYNSNVEIGLILGSEPKKFSIKVDKNSDASECRFIGKENDHGKKMFSFDKTKLPKNISITEQTQNIEGKAYFEFDLVDLPKYFWLSESNSKAISILPITVATCRHQHNILLKVVPDIEWTVNFLYNTPDPIWYGQSSPTYDIYGTEKTAVRDNTSIGDVKGAQNRVALADLKREENLNNANTRDGKKKINTALNRHFGDSKSNFGLSVKALYDNGKSQELSFKFAEDYRKTLSIIKSIYDLVDKVAGAKEAREASENLPPSLVGRRNMMSLSLLPPAPSVGVSWKYNNVDNRLGIELAGKVKIAPLIGGELKIDVLALADKIPLFGKLITALDLTTWLVEKIAMNTLSINYRIDLTFYANLALEEAFIKYNTAKVRGERLDADLKISGTLGGKLEISFDVKAKVTTTVEVGFEAGVKGDCYFKITANPNANYDNIIDWTTKFSGLIVTGYVKITSKRSQSDNEEKRMDPFILIPSYTGTPISLKFGEGKENKY